MKIHKIKIAKIARQNGQVATALNLFLAILGVGVLGLFAFEMSRYLLARDELKTNVEVAALSCQTALVSSGDPTSATNQTNAQTAGLQLFRQNSILGQSMAGATIASSPSALSPAPGQAQINFQFLDPITRLPVNQSGAGVSGAALQSSAAGTLIQAIGAYSYSPAFGQFIGLGNAQFTFQVAALSGVPKIDLIVLLDISGGMDNDTSISTYQRYQDTTGTNWMMNPNPTNGGTAMGLAYTILCDADIQALYPHQYEKIDNTNCVKVTYSESAKNAASNGLSGLGQGNPPGGNIPPSGGPSGGTSLLPESPVNDTPAMPGAGYHRQIIASLNEPLQNVITTQNSLTERFNKLITMQAKANIIAMVEANLPLENNLSHYSNNNLIALCNDMTNQGIKPNKTNEKIKIAKLDDNLSKISFAPQFYALQTGPTTSSSGAANPNPPVNYAGVNGQEYFASSRVASGGADNGAAVTPIQPIPYITGCGTAAPTVFTGSIVNGVIGVTSSDGTMSFTSAAAAIEAELGNLESATAAQGAGIDISSNGLNLNPGAGWFAFYYNTARQFVQPYMAVVSSLIGFINELAIVSDVHYGLIAFNDNVGTNANSVSDPINHFSQFFNQPTLNPDGTKSVSSTYPLPNIPLSTSTSNQSTIIPLLPTLSVWGNRNVTQALQTAYSQLQTNARPGANRAIVLVVCGPPNGNDSPANAIQQAATIGNAGIPIYVVCAAIQPNDDANNDAAYTASGGSNGGVAAASAHGAQYYRVDFVDPGTTNGALVSVFGNIARRLVSIMPGS